jgi:dephospho-CoA kinase
MKKIYVTGIGGTGKSTVAKRLNEIGIPAIDIDKEKEIGLCSWVHKKTGENAGRWHSERGAEFLETHDYICDPEKLKQLMNQYEGKSDVVVVVGLSDNQKDFLNLFDKVIFFDCDIETFLSRIDQREDNQFGKGEAERRMILEWYPELKQEMIELGAIVINVDDTPEHVLEKVISQIKS